MPARVLITGSQGFVGRCLRRLAEQRGIEVVGVGLPGSAADLHVDLSEPNFDAEALARSVGPVDVIFHLAARIRRGSSVDADARRNLRLVAEAPVRLMEAWSALFGTTHLVLCSSIKVYGQGVESPAAPEASPLYPDPFSYGSAKACAERFLEVSRMRGGGSYSVVRPAYIYGPGQHASNAIPAFLAAALAGRAPLVHGDGGQLRDDVFVGDVAYCLLEAGVRRMPGIVNAGGECARTLYQVAELCCRAAERAGGSKGATPGLSGQPPARWVQQSYDISRTRELLDYRPTSLLDGLTRQARWMASGSDPAKVFDFQKDSGS
jgi:nucleoside-diphosphate-sugar epimerase